LNNAVTQTMHGQSTKAKGWRHVAFVAGYIQCVCCEV